MNSKRRRRLPKLHCRPALAGPCVGRKLSGTYKLAILRRCLLAAVGEGKLQRRCWSSVWYAGMNKLPRRLFARVGARRCQPRWAVQGRRFSLPPTPPLMPPPPPPPPPPPVSSKPAAGAAGPEVDTRFKAGDYLILGAPPMPQPSISSDVCCRFSGRDLFSPRADSKVYRFL